MQNIFTVGPARIYPSVDKHIRAFMDQQMGSISHRSDAFRAMYASTITQLKQLLNIPADYEIYMAGSASEIWERILLNTVDAYSHHLVYGDFSKRFYQYALALQKNPSMQEVPSGKSFDIDRIIIPEQTELIGICQNETSTGAAIDLNVIYELRNRYPNKLLAIDIVSSTPYVNIDFTQVDMAFFSAQKGFGLPTGLGIWIVSLRAIERASNLKQKGIAMGAHHSIEQFHQNYLKSEVPSTPNILAIYLLGKVAADMLEYGIDRIRLDTEMKATLLDNAIENSPILNHFVTSPADRSKTTIVAEVSDRNLFSTLSQHNFILSNGYGKFADQHIRIGNFPSTSVDDVKELVNFMEKLF
ncbi:MAG: aminotransferase class V-fold PLP-dependent enzyme [Chitinophagales bacterium]|nr:aminotransferase class V-fold PLP-dependent enzyme [Chitinophagales bacterium]